MTTEQQIKQIVKQTVRESIVAFVSRRIGTVPNFQILDLIIPKERKIRSVVGGLETSLGTTLWEPLAKALATVNGFEVVNRDLQSPKIMPSSLNNTLQTIIDARKKNLASYTAEYCHNQIRSICQEFIENQIPEFDKAPRGYGVDIWLKKDGINYFFDTKTVQPNVGTFTKCMEQVLSWYAFFYSRYPNEKAEARIVFPYNPYPVDFWDKAMGKGKPLERGKEAWVENEFWDFCSGSTGTYTMIKQAFIELEASKELEEELKSIFYNN